MTSSEEKPKTNQSRIQRAPKKNGPREGAKPPAAENEAPKRSRIEASKLEAMSHLFDILFETKVPLSMKDLVAGMAKKLPGEGDVRISEKTISRYIAAMKNYNIKIESGSDGYMLDRSKTYPPLLLVWMALNNPITPQRSPIIIKRCIEYLETLRQKKTPSSYGTYQLCVLTPLSFGGSVSPPILDALRRTAGCSDDELLVELNVLNSFFSISKK